MQCAGKCLSVKQKFLGAYVPASLFDDLTKLALASDRSVSQIIRMLLAEGVKHRAGKRKARA